jgi:hypothetical protein
VFVVPKDEGSKPLALEPGGFVLTPRIKAPVARDGDAFIGRVPAEARLTGDGADERLDHVG